MKLQELIDELVQLKYLHGNDVPIVIDDAHSLVSVEYVHPVGHLSYFNLKSSNKV